MKKLSFLFVSAIISATLAGTTSAAVAQTTDADFQNALTQLRQSRQDFKNNKAQEVNAASEEGRAKVQAARQAAQQKRAEAQKRMEEKRKEVLLKLVDIQIKWMNRVKGRVQKMPNITNGLKIQLATEVDASIQKLNDEKAKIQSTSGQEAIKFLAKEVRDIFKSKKEIIKKTVDAIFDSRVNNATAKAEDRVAAIKAKIEELKSAGKDMGELEAYLADAEKKINEAQVKVGQGLFREANEDLKGAYQKFRGIADKAKWP
ncbi:MAG: hypothetical protein A3F95_01540 [Candidatus Nealsonbacteria bacterium RIFCSPLOWO2_12_FULL_39_31]|uniref:DUF5667 domain-containing protein n=2 Tax=Candidatus Nealsoniibacteriota TaxID=1817911 RepID=A0A1G2EMV2_9BACT|nr:MAG: hypothetical protein US88_C0015G0010 [Parcubacteria group bacterium GW2011_GWA2_38_27]KKQ97947.1 MAG: hypothetical protein UT22_C0006G0028 [Parcubacteria group bacterium GW2011_GWC2_39_11]OGZ19595.1 MAG: hypothetical protein A2626_00605 [Candidatus Nealsonbacteria bacterium RIFCSPHIGHO2_01_FULL_38_55]OGZ21574.1 MAG: hypothetical protein A2W55_01050 [Candidatus Nealsonbacteria bacterium RIFCSPHIGHO2_02_38_10]OGZ23273.1 MAG: hypothetical protein A3E18_00945 [Candidatus Nealsonbacteria bac